MFIPGKIKQRDCVTVHNSQSKRLQWTQKLQSTSLHILCSYEFETIDYRKRKLTDKAIPNVILQDPDFAEDSRMYQDLLETERKLDWTMMRKKVEVQDALARNPTVCDSLFTMHVYAIELVFCFRRLGR